MTQDEAGTQPVNTEPAKSQVASTTDIEKLVETRRTFLANLFGNPAFHIEAAAGPVLQGNTFWEELTCVGFNPHLERLEAIVSIKQATGYSGDVCTAGSTEYVRFFIDYGSGFQDARLATFSAHDLPNQPGHVDHPLSYMVSLTLDESQHQRFCGSAVLPKVRAVLSWNQIPSDPNTPPQFGNILDASIQLDPLLITLGVLEQEGLLKGIEHLPASIDLHAPLAQVGPEAVPWHKLIEAYRKDKVPDHRLLYPALHPLLKGSRDNAAVAHAGYTLLEQYKVNIADIIKAISQPTSNTTFEELTCTGLSTETDTLGAVIHLKRPSGYSGGLCQTGSKEYVAFWADWSNTGTFSEYLGTAQVDVHDINTIPADGLYYSVFLPVNLTQHLQACSTPTVIGLRAVLSWATPPSTTNPDELNYWGNRIDTRVQLRPARGGQGLSDLIYKVGSVPLDQISNSTFLAYPSGGILSGNCQAAAQDRPFGGSVSIQGRIYNTGTPGTVHYQVQYSPHGLNSWLPVSNQETFALEYPLDPVNPTHYVTINAPDGWFPYQEDPTASPPILERDEHLAWWSTGNLEGAYDLRLAYTTDYPLTPTSFIHYSQVVTIELDNLDYDVSPTANTVIDMSHSVDLVIDGGDCHSYTKQPASTINGHLRAFKSHFWKWELVLEPTTHTHGTEAVPACRSYSSLGDAGDANAAWTLNTGNLDACGYTLMLIAYDRTIVNSNGSAAHSGQKSVGFSVT